MTKRRDSGRGPSLWSDDYGYGGDSFGPGGKYEGQAKTFSCHAKHPDLTIGGGTLVGGNCRDHKRHENVDLYVALDGSMQHPYFTSGLDWLNAPVSLYYPIENMRIPKNPDKFKDLIEVIVDALAQGAKVHVGCIGGHGRTGMVLAAVVAKLGIAGEENDAIAWVRENYCKKAVENAAQEGFLATHFGVKLPGSAYPSKGVDKRTEVF